MNTYKVCSLQSKTVGKLKKKNYTVCILEQVSLGLNPTYATFYISFYVLKMGVILVPNTKDCFWC